MRPDQKFAVAVYLILSVALAVVLAVGFAHVFAAVVP